MHDSGVDDPDSVDVPGPAAEQVVRIDTGRVVHDQRQAVVVTVAGEIDRFAVKRLRAAVAAGFDQLRDGEILLIDLTGVTFLGSPGLQARSMSVFFRRPGRAPGRPRGRLRPVG